MDKNTIIGLLLIGAIMIGFTYYNKPDRDDVMFKKVVSSSERVSLNV